MSLYAMTLACRYGGPSSVDSERNYFRPLSAHYPRNAGWVGGGKEKKEKAKETKRDIRM